VASSPAVAGHVVSSSSGPRLIVWLRSLWFC